MGGYVPIEVEFQNAVLPLVRDRGAWVPIGEYRVQRLWRLFPGNLHSCWASLSGPDFLAIPFKNCVADDAEQHLVSSGNGLGIEGGPRDGGVSERGLEEKLVQAETVLKGTRCSHCAWGEKRPLILFPRAFDFLGVGAHSALIEGLEFKAIGGFFGLPPVQSGLFVQTDFDLMLLRN